MKNLEFRVFAIVEGERREVARFRYWLEALDYVLYALKRGALTVWAQGGAYHEARAYTLTDFPELLSTQGLRPLALQKGV